MYLLFLSSYSELFVVFKMQLYSQIKVYLCINHHKKGSVLLPDLPEILFTSNVHFTLFLLYYTIFFTEMKERNLKEMWLVIMSRESNQA